MARYVIEDEVPQPDPTGFEGKIIRDSHTGQRFKASGGRWVQQ